MQFRAFTLGCARTMQIVAGAVSGSDLEKFPITNTLRSLTKKSYEGATYG